MTLILALLLVADDPKVTLTTSRAGITASVSADLPDGALLDVRLVRLEERCVGDRIELVRSDEVRPFPVMIARGKAAVDFGVYPLAVYQVEAVFDPAMQSDDVVAALKKDGRAWTASAKIWSGAQEFWIKHLRNQAASVEDLRKRVASLVERGERALASAENWRKDGEAVMRETNGVAEKLLAFRRTAGISAAPALLSGICTDLGAHLRTSRFAKDGSIENPVDYHTGKKRTTARGKEFSFDELRAGLTLATLVMRREVWLLAGRVARPILGAWRVDAKARERLAALATLLLPLLTDVDPGLETLDPLVRRWEKPREDESPESAAKALDAIEESLRRLPEAPQ